MRIFANIETPVLFTMLHAHAAYYRKSHTKKSLAKCKRTINQIESEIDLREKRRAVNTVMTPLISLPLAI